MPPTAACKLHPTNPGDPCDFKTTPGDITIEVQEVPGGGLIDIAAAKYAGAPLTGTPGKKIKFTAVAGRKDLELIYLFSDPVNGHGELHEVCTGNPFLDTVEAARTSPTYTICA